MKPISVGSNVRITHSTLDSGIYNQEDLNKIHIKMTLGQKEEGFLKKTSKYNDTKPTRTI